MLKHSFVAAAILLGLGGTAAQAAPPPAKAEAPAATTAEGAHAATTRANHKADWKADKKADGQHHMNAQKPEAPAHP